MTRRNRAAAVVAVAVVAVLVGAGIAYASIPAPDGTINGCRKNTDGSLRAIDSGATCPNGYTALNWRQAGGSGAFTAVANVPVVYGQSPGTVAHGTANCPAGMIASGGGFVSVATLEEKWVPIINSPVFVPGAPVTAAAIGWEVSIEMEGTPLPPGSGNAVLTVYAMCLPSAA